MLFTSYYEPLAATKNKFKEGYFVHLNQIRKEK